MIVDTEAHPLLFGRYAPNNGNKTLIKHYTWCEHSPELLVAEMDNAGVDKAFLISYDAEDIQFPEETKGYTLEDYAGGRKYSLRGLRQFPDRFWWFNTVKDPKRYDAAAKVAQDFADGAMGIKLFPCYIQCHLNDPGLVKVFETVRQHKGRALVSFQSWRDGKIPFATYMEEAAEMLARFPEVNVALMQAGCVDPLKPEIEPVLDLVRRFPNCYLSTGYCGEVWDDGTEWGVVRQWGNDVRDRLADIPGVSPLPLSWLIVFSGAYLTIAFFTRSGNHPIVSAAFAFLMSL